MTLSRRQLGAMILAAAAAGPAQSALAQSALPQSDAVVAPFTLQNGRLLVQVTLNGKGPFELAIDTGAVVSGIEDPLAKRLGLKPLRDVRLSSKSFPLYAVDEMVIGGAVRQENAAMFGLDLRLRGAVGLLAAGTVTAFDSELDFDRLQWRVFPGGQAERPGFTAIESSIRQDPGANGSKRIGLRAELDGRPLKLLVDTGSPRAVTLDPDAVRRLGLWDDSRPFAPVGMVGIDGPTPAPGRTIRCESLTVGPAHFERPLVSLRPPGGKPMIDFDGFIGLPAIQRMNLSVQPRAGKLWIKPNGLPYGPETVNRTGLWLDTSPGGGKIVVVGTGSPAEGARLKAGDLILDEPKFGALLQRLGGPAGSEVSLSVKTAEGTKAVNLVLKDYV